MPRNRPPALPPLPCPLTYGADGEWLPSTITAARQCVLNNLERDLAWWKNRRNCPRNEPPDIDGTLCRTDALYQKAFQELLAPFGYDVDEAWSAGQGLEHQSRR